MCHLHLQEALKLQRGGRALVFARNVAAANELAAGLQRAGLQPLLYHRDVAVHLREEVLAQMASRCACAGGLAGAALGAALASCKLGG